jgi:hypothetical protein
LTRDFQLVRGSGELLPEIVACINRNHRRRQFAPHYAVEQFTSALSGFKFEDFYVAIRDNEVVGVVGKWDQSAFKQTFVTGYRGKTRLLRPVYNLASALTGGATYPAPGAQLRFFYVSFIAVDDDDVAVFKTLLWEIYNDHVGSQYSYFVMGLHERDPLCAVLKDFYLTPFSARLFAVHLGNGVELARTLNGMVPYVELAQV